ncbi:DUF1173 family protein [Kozakia baliensis]|uniref:Uncharacterized protein n=2 Tax=Kozakia baliensis TaxID=153496 RepID=A0A1D8UXM4_9PROT|nr:DUF1173 family protein [Kozakia baliensis]AOX18405.1 hypothetical protein A0U89_13880 [Kozakia baliensis]GEL65155.1 hypothetical protein KBA01_24410 [Kozakia baliensis]
MTDQWIRLPGNEGFNLAWKETEPARYQSRLAARRVENLRAGPGERAHCDCRHLGGFVELQIRQRGDACHLAVWPDTGTHHEPGCAFHRPDPDRSGRAGYSPGVIIEREEEDHVTIRLGLSLRRRAPGPEPVVSWLGGRQGAGTQRRMTLLGLLHLLWEKAGLHYWRPAFSGHRTPANIFARLSWAASQIHVGRTTVLGDLFCPVVSDDQKAVRRFHHRVDRHVGTMRLVIVGRVESLREAAKPGQHSIRLAGDRAGYRLFLSIPSSRWQRIANAAPREIAHLERENANVAVFGLFVVTAARLLKGKYTGFIDAQVEDAALMTTTDQIIPVESRYEAQIAELLVAQRRTFEKPLRFDASTDLVRPDFVLLDTPRANGFPMEVFGMASTDYLARRAEKEVYYATHFGDAGWWAWNVLEQTRPPCLPAPCSDRSAFG